jgi:hypothetical protein
MSPMKLSLINTDNDEPDETIELDDELAGKLKRVVDETPDLTMAEALRRGIAHVAENRPTTGGSSPS